MDTAPQFTPELNQGYLASLLNSNVENEQNNIKKARDKYSAGGLDFQASSGAEIGAIGSGYEKNMDRTIGKFNLDVANNSFKENVNNEMNTFADTERLKNEEFKRTMDQLGYDFTGKQAELARHQKELITKASVMGIGVGAAAKYGSSYAGSKFGGSSSGSGGGSQGDYTASGSYLDFGGYGSSGNYDSMV